MSDKSKARPTINTNVAGGVAPPLPGPTPLLDWTVTPSSVNAGGTRWDQGSQVNTPLSGYGRGELFTASVGDAATQDDNNTHHDAYDEVPPQPEEDDSWKHRTQSEIITDQLHRQGQFFPPPPPPCCPDESARERAELWYRSAGKWDITNTIPPPPRSPLEGMDEEYNRQMREFTLVPYRGAVWLQQSEHWFAFVQKHFNHPEANVLSPSSHSFLLESCSVE